MPATHWNSIIKSSFWFSLILVFCLIFSLNPAYAVDLEVPNGIEEDFLTGTEDPDTLTNNGTVFVVIEGLGGDDVIINNAEMPQGAGNIDGGGGDDQITNNGFVNEIIVGDDGNDTITNTINGRASAIYGDDGDDSIFNEGLVAGFPEGVVAGGDGDDLIVNEGLVIGFDGGILDGEDDNDTIINTVTGETGLIFGGAGNDILTNSGYVDIVIWGEDGDDIITNTSTGLAQFLDGGPGDDQITNRGEVFAILGDTLGDPAGAGDDIIINSGFVEAGISGDSDSGGSGNDYIFNEGTGDVGFIDGGGGHDTIINNGYVDDDVDGGKGNDTITNGGFINDDLNGNDGDDTLVNNGTVGDDFEGDDDNPEGVDGNDHMTNNGVVKEDMDGGGGDDFMVNNGHVGEDLKGEDGNDTVINDGSVGGDILMGNGHDKLILTSGFSIGGIADGGPGTDILRFEGGGTVFAGDYINFEHLELGGNGKTNLTGHWRFDSLLVNGGMNTLTGTLRVNNATLSGGYLTVNGSATVLGSTMLSSSLTIGPSGSYHTGSFSLQSGGMLDVQGSFTSDSPATVEGSLTVDGTFSGPLKIKEGGGLFGNGTLNGDVEICGVVSPGSSLGTLTINGNLTVQSTANYIAEIAADGDSDLISVSGSATLNGGTLTTSLPRALYPDGTSWNVIKAAGGVSGDVDSISHDYTGQTLTPDLQVSGSNANLVLMRTSYSAFGQTVGEKAAGRGLDSLVPMAAGTGDSMEELLIALDFDYSAAEIKQALTAFSPDMYDAFLAAALNTAQVFDDLLQDRSDVLRLHRALEAGPVNSDQDSLITLASADTELSGLGSAQQQPGRTGSVWVQALGGLAQRDDSDEWLGYELSTAGAILGYDAQVQPWLSLGASLGFSTTDMDYDGSLPHDGEQQSINGGIYASANWEQAYLDAGVSYGYHDSEAERSISFREGSATTRADFESQSLLARLSGGYDFAVDNWRLGPLAQLAYVYLDQNGFNESGADYLNLRLADYDDGYLYSRLGLRVAALFRSGEMVWLPRLSLAWQHNFEADREITASFRDYAGAPFTAQYSVDDDALALTAGLNLKVSELFGAYLNYHLLWSENWIGHSGSLGIQLRF